MSKVIRPASLQKELEDILKDYEAEVKETINEALPKVGRETVKELKRTSPEDRGKYKKTWKSKIEEDRLGKKLIVYNDVNYRLTHLLEFGHAKVNGGRTKAQEHIGPAQERAVEKIVKEIRRKLG